MSQYPALFESVAKPARSKQLNLTLGLHFQNQRVFGSTTVTQELYALELLIVTSQPYNSALYSC